MISGQGHLALIVEDDVELSSDWAEVLTSLGCDSVVVDSKSAALAALDAHTFCFVLLDLQIKSVPDSVAGHTEHGSSLLRELRRRYAEHTGPCYWFPILVVSGMPREVPMAVELMRDGASDMLQKPVAGRDISELVRRALQLCGRTTHEACRGPAPVAQAAGPGDTVLIAVPGDREGRRTRVMIGKRALALTDGTLRLLLHLLVARTRDGHVHKTELGGTDDQGFRGVSELRKELRVVLGTVEVIENDHHGNYSLVKQVEVGACNVENLKKIGVAEISRLARELNEPRGAGPPKSDGKS